MTIEFFIYLHTDKNDYKQHWLKLNKQGFKNGKCIWIFVCMK